MSDFDSDYLAQIAHDVDLTLGVGAHQTNVTIDSIKCVDTLRTKDVCSDHPEVDLPVNFDIDNTTTVISGELSGHEGPENTQPSQNSDEETWFQVV